MGMLSKVTIKPEEAASTVAAPKNESESERLVIVRMSDRVMSRLRVKLRGSGSRSEVDTQGEERRNGPQLVLRLKAACCAQRRRDTLQRGAGTNDLA